MDLTILYIVVGVCVPLALGLCVLLFFELSRMMATAKLYSVAGRDLRFVCALLRQHLPGGKWRILRHPCILPNSKDAPPRADLLIIGGGGLLVLTVDDREGHFVTPPTGDWTLWKGNGYEKVANRFNEGRKYTAVLNNLVVRAGLSCPVINIIVLSDDEATADDLYAENVLTCDQLVPYLKRFCKGRMLSTARQKKLREVLASHHVRCRRALEQLDNPIYQPVSALEQEADYTADSLFGEESPDPTREGDIETDTPNAAPTDTHAE
ncbi:MAG: NERD domain-containing protein [Clostridia bacterium]|nr:NERD domain-containing protein [Clostridia bacterium]